MHKSKRLGLVLTPAEKNAVVRLAEVEGGLSQAAVVRRLIRQAAKSHGLWPAATSAQTRPTQTQEAAVVEPQTTMTLLATQARPGGQSPTEGGKQP
jgi:hypothetical protein